MSAVFKTRVARMHPLVRYVFTLVVLAGITAAWLFGSYFTTCTSVEHVERRIKDAQQQLAFCHNSKDTCLLLQDAVNKLDKKVNTFVASVHNKTYQEYLTFVLRQAHESFVALHSCERQKHSDSSWYTNTTVNLSISGSMQQLLTFFKKISASNNMVNCYNIHLNKQKDDNMQCTCNVDFMLLRQESIT